MQNKNFLRGLDRPKPEMINQLMLRHLLFTKNEVLFIPYRIQICFKKSVKISCYGTGSGILSEKFGHESNIIYSHFLNHCLYWL